MNNKETFSYSYSATQREELESIRKKYLPAEENKMEIIRKLDERVTAKASIIAMILGIIGSLIFGLGMSCVLVWAGGWLVPGIFIGIVGLVALIAAYPTYIRVFEKEKEKVAPEILRLTEELMK